MKKMKFLGIALIVLIAGLALTACAPDFSDLIDTHWRVQILGSGTGYHFIDADSVQWEIGLLGEWGDSGIDIAYTYSAADFTGTMAGDEFVIDPAEQTLTMDSVAYEYDATP